MELIHFKSVVIEREEQTLLDGIDFQISSGEFVYLIGKVGCGKSSLLQTIYGELPIAAGEAQVLDYDLRHLRRSQIPYLRRKLGIIFQDFQLLTDRIVSENLRFVLKATGWHSKQEIDERIETVLAQVGMENKGYRMPNTLSGGEQQRVVIARALLNAPDLILADEPTGNLDPETGGNIVQLLHDICNNQHTSVIMSTHNLNLPELYPGRVLMVEDRKLIDVTERYCPQKAASVSIPDTTECDPKIQSASLADSVDNSNDEAHCSPTENPLAAQCCNEQSDQTPAESTAQ
jgi:cell division transport system ATP-binding protein